MKSFLIKVLLFSLPIFLLFIPPFLVLRISKEGYFNIDKVIDKERDYLIGYAYHEDNYKYIKWKELTSKPKRSVVALGSSRVLQFRAQMFQSDFYNSGYTISSITDFIPFLEGIPSEKYPETLIIGLDQWMYNKAWDPIAGEVSSSSKWKNSFKRSPSIGTSISIWKDLAAAKYGMEIFQSADGPGEAIKIGLNALVNNKGFRSDGSIYYGSQIDKLVANDPSARDYAFEETFGRIDNGNKRFEYGEEINPKALEELEKLLAFCKNHNIYLIGFLPPFAEGVQTKMDETGQYGYVKGIYDASKAIFDKNEFEFWDLSDLSTFGSSDKEVIDGHHGGEATYLKMLVYMLENGSKLSKHADAEQLKADLKKSRDAYIVYE